jgi:hypothetical protein
VGRQFAVGASLADFGDYRMWSMFSDYNLCEQAARSIGRVRLSPIGAKKKTKTNTQGGPVKQHREILLVKNRSEKGPRSPNQSQVKHTRLKEGSRLLPLTGYK